MTGLLHKLEDQHAILLMFLANELPPDDRAQVQRMLESDPAMRAELEQLQNLQSLIGDALRQQGPAVGERPREAAVRRVAREMRRRHLELQARPALVPAAPPRHAVPVWIYPLAAAAAVIFLLIGLWGMGIIGSQEGPSYVTPLDPADHQMVIELERSFTIAPTPLDDVASDLRFLIGEEEEPAFPML